MYFAVIKASPVSQKLVLVTSTNSGNIIGYVCMANCNVSSNWNVSANLGTVYNADNRGFDIEFETSTGDAVLVYADAGTNNASRDLGYWVLPASASNFSSALGPYYINDTSGHSGDVNYTWVRLDRKPMASEEMIFTAFDISDNDINAWVWNGNNWTNQTELSSDATATNADEALAVRYSADGTKGMAIAGNGTTGNITWRYWNGASWSALGVFDCNGADTDSAHWLNLKADPASDDLQAVIADSADDMHTAYWNGSTWAVTSNIETALSTSATGDVRPVDFEWNPSGSTGVLVWDNNGNTRDTTQLQRTCAPQCNGATTSQTNLIYNSSTVARFITLYRDPTDNDTTNILAATLHSQIPNAFNLSSFRFNGTNYSNYGDSAILAPAYFAAYESYSIAFYNSTAPSSISNVSIVKLNQTALQASPGGTVQFNITVNNTGNTVLNLTVTDALPAGLTFASAYPANTSAGPAWNYTGLAAGGYQVYYLNATVDAGVVNATTPIRNLTNNVSVTAKPPTGSNVTANSSANVTVYYANVTGVKANLTAQVASQGGMVQYLITVNNTGNVSLNITVNDTLDAALQYNSSSPAGTLNVQNINWTFVVASGSTQTIYLNATVRNYPAGCQNTINYLNVTGVPPNGNSVNATTSLIVPVCLADVSVIKLNQDLGQPSPGGEVEFNITVTNNGNVTLDPVTVIDVLPAGLIFDDAAPYPAISGQQLTWNGGAFDPGDSGVIYVWAKVNASAVDAGTPIINLTNYVNATGSPPNGANVTAESRANVTVYYANISVIKLNQTAEQPSPGGIVEFNITIKNEGNVTLDPVEVMDVLPDGLTFTDATPYPDETGGPLVWYNTGSLDPGDSYVLYVSAEVDDGVVDNINTSAALNNKVNVTGTPPNGDDVTANDDADVTVYYAEVGVVKAQITPVMPIAPGGLVLWRLTVTNTGAANLDHVLVMDTLDYGLVYNSSATTPDSVSADGLQINWTVGALAPAGFQIIDFYTTANDVGTYYNNVNVIGYPVNGASVNDSNSANVGINSSGIGVTKTVSDAEVYVNANDLYTLNIPNTGEVDLVVEVVDTLPANVIFQGSDVPETSYVGQVVTWSGIPLPVGDSIIINYNVSANATGTYSNYVVVTGVPQNGGAVSDDDSASFTAGRPASHDNGAGAQPISVSVSSTCDGNLVTVESGGHPLAGAEVKVKGKSIGNTNSKGQIAFEGCDMVDAIVLAKKGGYIPDNVHVDTVACSQCAQCTSDAECPTDSECTGGKCVQISCECGKIENHACTQYECCSDSQCGQGETCANHACNKPFECTKNTDCSAMEYCAVQAGQAGGDCKPVAGGCGVVSNHAFTPYECGVEPGCPSCPSGSVCSDNKCASYAATAPEKGVVGDNATVHVTVDGKPCSACEIVITNPDGTTRTGRTDGNGDLVLPLQQPGSYRISLPDGSLLRTLTAGVAPKANVVKAGNETPVTSTAPAPLPCILGAILLVLAIVIFYLWQREKSGKEPLHAKLKK